jgi:drug/metabolite transporter (DMT)-like permease
MKEGFVAPPPSRDHRRGILLAIVTTLMFASMDGVSKHLGGRFPVAEIVWFQYVVVIGFALIFSARSRGRNLLASAFPVMQILRGAILVIETALFVLAFRHLALADAHAIGAAAPLIATVLAVLVLKESVGATRWVALLVGFAGVLIIIRPGAGVFGTTALIPLTGAALFAIYQVLNKKV